MMSILLSGIASFLLVALGVFVFRRRRNATGYALIAVVLLLAGIELFDELSLRLSADFAAFRQAALFLEALLPGSFLVLSILYGRSKPFSTVSKFRAVFMAVLAVFPVMVLITVGNRMYDFPDIRQEGILLLGRGGYWYYIGILVALIVALVNVEATLTSTHGIARNRMKFEAFGIMTLIAVLIFYYSQGLLYRTLNLNLVQIRASVSIIAVLLIGYSQAFRGGEMRVSLSRHVVYRSIALLAVSFYLITVGMIGEGMQHFGETFGRQVTIVLAFAGGILLLLMLYSDRARRIVKVYISKHFYSNKHDYREEWLRLTNRLSSCAALYDVQESILTAYQETFGVAGASLYFQHKDERQYVRVLDQNMSEGPTEIRLSEGLRDYFTKRERVLNIADGEYPLSDAEHTVFRQARAWLVVPLISNGKIEGLALLREQIIPEMLIYDDFDLMKVMARQAAQAVANLRLSEEIVDMRAMSAVSQISTFVIHDLKNMTTSLSLVVDNAQEHIGNPDFQKDAITTIHNSLVKMKKLIQRLKSIPEKISLDARVEDIDRLARETVADLAKLSSDSHVLYNGMPVYARVDGEEIRKVIMNLVRNALEAGHEKGSVIVSTFRENGSVCIRVSDTAGGMTETFINNNLFKPFRTTKETGLGIGLYQCKQIVEAHKGRIEVKSEVNKGTVFTVFLPGADSDQVTQ